MDVGISLIRNIIKLISLETQLASKSLLWIIITYMFIAIFMTGCWGSILAIVSFLLIEYDFSFLFVLSIDLLLNLMLLFVFVCLALGLKQNLLFNATRRQLSRLIN
jgi:hypothetical protein